MNDEGGRKEGRKEMGGRKWPNNKMKTAEECGEGRKANGVQQRRGKGKAVEGMGNGRGE
jgi:hypothetical protein